MIDNNNDTIICHLFLSRSFAPFYTPITWIINKSFDQCVFPKGWKRTNVVPIQKKKGDVSMSNFRPISILPACVL